MLGLRFTCDKRCPPERFETLRRELGPTGFRGIEIDSSENNPFNETIKPKAHSVLTTELVLQDAIQPKKRLMRC